LAQQTLVLKRGRDCPKLLKHFFRRYKVLLIVLFVVLVVVDNGPSAETA
jgi:hypothetical protein